MMIQDNPNTEIKYSLKNKEFNKKKHHIFDLSHRKSRSKTLSPSPSNIAKKQTKNNFTKNNQIYENPSSFQHSVVERFNEFSTNQNSSHRESNQQEKSLFQSFSKAQKSQTNNRLVATNNHKIKPAQPLKIPIQQKNNFNLQNIHRNLTQLTENRNESFQVCEGSSRVNRFFSEGILNKESQQSHKRIVQPHTRIESPHNKIVFEPVIRNSLSRSHKSLSPVHVQQRITMNRVNPINLQIIPNPKLQPTVQNYPTQRRMVIMQIPRQHVFSQPMHQNQNNKFIQAQINTHQKLKFPQQNQELIDLKKKIQQQNLQIQYLKNQKQILQSNIQLQFSPKKGYQTSRNQQPNYRTVTPEKYGQYSQIQNQIDKTKLFELTQILSNNHLKLTLMQQKYQKIYTTIFNRFDESLLQCQKLLIQLFSQKYFVFSQQLNAKLSLIDRKSAEIQQFQSKIDIFANTFRNIEESLRITNLKQQNIELLIQNQNKQSDPIWKKQQGSKLLMMQHHSDISSIRKYEDNQMEQKQRQDLYKLQKNIGMKNLLPQWDEQSDDFKELDSFLDDKYSHLVYQRKKQTSVERSKSKGSSNSRKKKQKHFKNHHKPKSPAKDKYFKPFDQPENYINKLQNRSTSQQIQQYSPFQANQMFKNQPSRSHNHRNFMKYSQVLPQNNFLQSQNNFPNKYPSHNKNKSNVSFNEIQSLNNFDFSQNSFEIQMDFKTKTKNQIQKQISFNSNDMFKKVSSKMNTQKQDISDTLQGQQQRLISILKGKKYQFPIDCWLDEMGCLRKKNQTYIFDEQGSVIITTAAAFKKLKEKRIFS